MGCQGLLGEDGLGCVFWTREGCGFPGGGKSWRKTMTLRAETKLDSRLERGRPSSCLKSPASSGWSLDVILEGNADRACSRSDSPDSTPLTATPPWASFGCCSPQQTSEGDACCTWEQWCPSLSILLRGHVALGLCHTQAWAQAPAQHCPGWLRSYLLSLPRFPSVESGGLPGTCLRVSVRIELGNAFRRAWGHLVNSPHH